MGIEVIIAIGTAGTAIAASIFKVGRQMERLTYTLQVLSGKIDHLQEYDKTINYRLTDVENWLQKNTEFEKRHP